ncbi:MAG: helix-turn-helix domain-containing protein [Flavobacteriales bacterium]|nr:helix-turn-helix domain-containing protein [Flavobacteriales bacterium]
MIRLDIHRLLALNNIRYGRSFLINHGFTPSEARGLLHTEAKEVRLVTMERLCNTFHCQPNDLFTWIGDRKSHLNALKKSDFPELARLLAGKSPQEIEEILRRIERGG